MPFKPGQSGNPAGRPKLSPELRKIRELNGEEIRRLFAKYARMTRMQLQESIDNPNTPVIELIIATGISIAYLQGDYTRLNFILNRTIGPIKENNTTDDRPQVTAHMAIIKMIETNRLQTQSNNVIDIDHEL